MLTFVIVGNMLSHGILFLIMFLTSSSEGVEILRPILSLSASAAGAGGVTHLIVKRDAKECSTFATALSMMMQNLGTLIISGLLLVLAIGVTVAVPLLLIITVLGKISAGFIALLALVVGVIGVTLLCRWFVIVPVVMVEEVGPIEAFRRSTWLTAGYRWERAAFFLLIGGIAWGVNGLVSLVTASAIPAVAIALVTQTFIAVAGAIAIVICARRR